MSPDPNNPDDKTADVNPSMVVNMVMPVDDEQNFSSDDSDNDAEYNAYKPLAQDDIPNGHMSDTDDDDEDNDSDNDNSDTNDFQDLNFVNMETITSNEASQTGINYQNLYCEGVDDDLGSSSLGIPASFVENEIQSDTTEDTINIDMSETQVELVRNAMAGFSLPAINIPDWAKDISEDDWKETLINTIQKKPGT